MIALILILLILLSFDGVYSFNPCIHIAQFPSLKSNSQKVRLGNYILSSSTIKLQLVTEANTAESFDASAWLNPNTRGGVLVWCALLTLIPIGIYQYFISTGLEPVRHS